MNDTTRYLVFRVFWSLLLSKFQKKKLNLLLVYVLRIHAFPLVFGGLQPCQLVAGLTETVKQPILVFNPFLSPHLLFGSIFIYQMKELFNLTYFT